jgi:hypothetical protein
VLALEPVCESIDRLYDAIRRDPYAGTSNNYNSSVE